MKFLCPECKAKYKIADDKVAGRSAPRMKCRKCGHIIDIRSAVSIDDDADEGPEERSSGVGDVVSSHPAPAPVPAPAPRPPAGASPRPTGARSKVAAPPRRGAPTQSPRGARAASSAAADFAPRPRSSPKSSIGAAPRAAAAVALPPAADPVSVRIAEEFQPEPATTPQASPFPVAQSQGFDEEPTVIKDLAALSAAFSDALGTEESPRLSVAADEWYVGIEGTPTGPLSLDDIKEKAREGKATTESLVWKEGFEEWKPLSSFPELVSLVEEARQASAPAVQAPPSVIVAEPAQAKVEVPPAASVDLEELPSFVKKRTGTPTAAWLAILIAVLFGVTIGIVFFSKQEREPIVKYVEVPAKDDKKQEAEEPPAPAVLEEEAVVGNTGSTEVRQPSKAARPVATEAPARPGLLSGLGGPQTSGPNAAAGSGSGSGSNVGQLDSASIQRTVSNYTPSVRRGCWEPALGSRTRDAPSSAKVQVTIVVAPTGAVKSVSAGADPRGYPGLARCIEGRIRAWKFPRGGSETTVNVPFVFAAQ